MKLHTSMSDPENEIIIEIEPENTISAQVQPEMALSANAIAPFRIPEQLNIFEGNISENFKTWKRQMEIYLKASGVEKVVEDVQTAIIVNTTGPAVLKAYGQWKWDNPGDKDKQSHFWSKLESHCFPRKNEVIESSRFWNAEQAVPFDSWLTELRTKNGWV